MPRLDIKLLGARRLQFGQHRLEAPKRNDALRLWACLLLFEGARARAIMAAELWPDLEPPRARAALRHSLHVLRQSLPEASSGEPWILADRHELQWNPKADARSDIQALREAAAAEVGFRQSRLDRLREVAGQDHGPLLPGLDDPWTLAARHEIKRWQLQVIARLAAGLEELGDLSAIEYSRALLDLEPSDEACHRRLMRLEASRGDLAAVRRQFERCTEALREHLDSDPAPETVALLASLTGRHGAGGELEPTQARSGRGLHEPKPGFGLRVDRLGRLDSVSEALEASRLLTLWGPGGVGKSRLARAAIRDPRVGRPCLSASLADVSDSAGLITRLAETLELPAGPRTVRRLAEVIGRRELLLLFDDGEQLAGALSMLLPKLLERCDGLRVLITSRERLRLPNELPLLVPALSQRGDAQSPRGEAAELLSIALDENIAESAPLATGRITAALDGLPRSLMAAAIALRLRSPEQVARMAESGIEALDELAPMRQERFVSLARAFDHDLLRLDPPGRQLLHLLATGDGPKDLEGLHRTQGSGASSGPWPTQVELLMQLTDLRARSLIEIETGVKGETVYRLLRSTRLLVLSRIDGMPPS